MGTWKGIVGTGFDADSFDAYVRQQTFGVWRPQFVVVHNTQEPTLAQWKRKTGAAWMSALTHYYRDENGWSGGPHLFVDDARIWVFTPLTSPGVHSPSWNRVALGVELVGDYDRERMPPSLLQNAVAALATLHGVLGLDPSTLKLHKDDPKTTHTFCPGKRVEKAGLIAAVQEALTERHSGEHLPGRVIAS
jgi:hypothetical protein